VLSCPIQLAKPRSCCTRDVGSVSGHEAVRYMPDSCVPQQACAACGAAFRAPAQNCGHTEPFSVQRLIPMSAAPQRCPNPTLTAAPHPDVSGLSSSTLVSLDAPNGCPMPGVRAGTCARRLVAWASSQRRRANFYGAALPRHERWPRCSRRARRRCSARAHAARRRAH